MLFSSRGQFRSLYPKDNQMPNSSKSLKAIQAAFNLTREQKLEKQRLIIERSCPISGAFRLHPAHNPIAHWSGVSQRVLGILRANRSAILVNGGVVNGAFGTYLPLDSFYNPAFAPMAGSLVEHEKLGLGIVEGATNYASNTGMTTTVFFEDADRSAIVFCDELMILDGDLVGTTNELHPTIVSKARRLDIDEAKAQALKARYQEEEADADESEDFQAFMAEEFDSETL